VITNIGRGRKILYLREENFVERATSMLCSLVLALSLFLSAFAVHADSRNWFVQHYGREPANSRVLMLIPDDFDRYSYMSTYAGRPTSNDFGRRAARLLDIALRSEFESFGTGRARSTSEAMARLSGRDADLTRFDLIAIPRFGNVRYWTRGWEYGFDVDLVVEFYRPDGAKVTSIRGHGETRTGSFSGASPGDSGDRALRMAVSAVRDGVIRWNEGRV
jgi:hypothetical protein